MRNGRRSRGLNTWEFALAASAPRTREPRFAAARACHAWAEMAMTRIIRIDLSSFLLLERANRPNHGRSHDLRKAERTKSSPGPPV